MSIIKFDNVGMRYGADSEIFKDVSFEIQEGSFHYLTGPSGAGKTSLLRLMYCARRPSRGLVYAFGKDTSLLRRKDFPEFRRRIGIVFQDFRLLDYMTALENVALPLRAQGVSSDADIVANASEILRWVGLEKHMDAYPQTLSGGQQQRVAIARAVIVNPKILLADEPTGNVDDAIARKLLFLFEKLNKNGCAIVLATHSQDLINYSSHPRLHVADGRVSVLK